MISLYFHIPFCTKKCPYCHFYVVRNAPSQHKGLMEAFSLEWQQKLPKMEGKKLASLYFGGGTPSLFAPDGIRYILSLVQSTFSLEGVEVTIEANPEESSEALFKELLEMGVNRLSLGVQSLDDRSLETLERTHSAKQAKEAIFSARRAGFQNISIDLMYDLPDQTLSSWSYTLKEIEKLPIEHLSLYNMTIEPHTSFYKRRKNLTLPDSRLSLELHEKGVKAISQAGLKRYEISAFSKVGFESIHNVGYWTGRPFLGFGPSAFSFWEGSRFQNISHLLRYKSLLKEGKEPIDFQETLAYPDSLHEQFAVHLRLLQGVPKKKFPLTDALMQKVEKLEKEGLLQQTSEAISMTSRGLLFYDTIASEII